MDSIEDAQDDCRCMAFGAALSAAPFAPVCSVL